VAGSCEYGDEPGGSGATELANKHFSHCQGSIATTVFANTLYELYTHNFVSVLQMFIMNGITEETTSAFKFLSEYTKERDKFEDISTDGG
jgi:hypothetical protein